MPKSVKRIVKNSFFQVAGAFSISGLNMLLTFGYAQILGQDALGALVVSQAKVMVWALLVDLGLSHGLISALTVAEGRKIDGDRQGFRTRDLVMRVLFLRFMGAAVATAAVFFLAARESGFGTEIFWQDVASTPFLFALALQQTALALASFRRYFLFSVFANVFGMAVTAGAMLMLARAGGTVRELLFFQSACGFITGLMVFSYFFTQWLKRKRQGSRRSLRRHKGPWARAAWHSLAKNALPFGAIYSVTILWARLDQIMAGYFFGPDLSGRYALAIRMVAFPLVLATAASHVIFPEVQRVGRDAPEKLPVILGLLMKILYRYGVLFAALFLSLVALASSPFVPRFSEVARILPFFVPGIWAFWMQTFVINAILGLRRYSEAVTIHLAALFFYLVALLLLPRYFGLLGIVCAFDIYCIVMFYCGYRYARALGAFDQRFALLAGLSEQELELWNKTGLQILFRFFRKKGSTF